MPDIRLSADAYMLRPGQTRDAQVDPATGEYVAEVDEVLAGETEITPEEHAKVKAAAEAAYEAERAALDLAPVEAAIAVEWQPPLSQDELTRLRAILAKG